MDSDEAKIDLVRRWFEGFTTWENTIAMVREMSTEDCTWEHPGGLPTTEGRDAMVAFAESYREQSAIVKMHCDIKAIAVSGDTVLTERIDQSWDADGKLLHTLRVCGANDVRDGKISSFREYFDPTVGHV